MIMKNKTTSTRKITPAKKICIDITRLKEDPLDDQTNPEIIHHKEHLATPIEQIQNLLHKELITCAKHLDIEKEELQAWIDCQVTVPQQTLLCLLRTANTYGLDPLQEEIILTQYENHWRTSISVDGWIKLLHQNPAFSGITFTECPASENPSSIWMECTIYRSDQIIPTTIREYLSEVMNESEIWKKMPKRMLRHRVLQQCARIAIGIKPPETQNENGHQTCTQTPQEQTEKPTIQQLARSNAKGGLQELRARLAKE